MWIDGVQPPATNSGHSPSAVVSAQNVRIHSRSSFLFSRMPQVGAPVGLVATEAALEFWIAPFPRLCSSPRR